MRAWRFLLFSLSTALSSLSVRSSVKRGEVKKPGRREDRGERERARERERERRTSEPARKEGREDRRYQ